MNNKLDVVDIYTKLKKSYPHVEFSIFEEEKPIGRDYYTFHKFKLERLFNTRFNPPIKTSISFLKGDYIDDHDFYQLELKMNESFNLEKLLIK
jgi:hypothetical protein